MSFRPPIAPKPLPPGSIEEREFQESSASKEERLRNLQWKLLGFNPAIKCPHLKGRIIKNDNGVQVIETDSKEAGKRLIHQLGFCYIQGGEVGDYVELEYRVHMEKNVAMWFGWITRKGS